MNRREVLGAGALGAAAAALAGCSGQTGAETDAASEASPAAPAVNRGLRELTMVTTWPKNFPGLGDAAERTAAAVEAMTDGALKIRVYASGEIVPALQSFDAVVGGSADMYHGAEYYWQGKSKGFNFFAAVPFGLTATEFNAWMSHGGGQALWDDLAGEFGVKGLVCGNTGVQMAGWFNKEINSIDDFRGLTMRIPGLGGEVLRGLGGAAVTLSGEQIFQNLQSGQIDATEWVGPWNDYAFQLHRAAQYYYGPGFHEPGTALSLGVNRTVWESLPADHQAVIEHASAAATNRAIGEFAYENARALKTLASEHGVELRAFSEDVWRAIGAIAEDVVAAAGDADPKTRAIYDSFRAARADLSDFSARVDAPYMRFRAATLAARG